MYFSGKEVDSNFLATPIEFIIVMSSEEKSSLKIKQGGNNND